ncbi:Hypothetical protein Minf_1124 [Methylacidiphilum infernorum V4]|uniref:Uncharacterized protein n=1 Tax=Methylacidiphilum infernorum (isolate V4) TaxID=481448 RepID=B3DV26_METI4|nr:Hypothetical protein Minf_1124 [Methylacidiphilum infernorum V4]
MKDWACLIRGCPFTEILCSLFEKVTSRKQKEVLPGKHRIEGTLYRPAPQLIAVE